jgi:hypothetical protein
MVLMALDTPNINVVENHQFLSQEEMKQFFGVYQGSGGYISGISNVTFSGANNIPSTLVNRKDVSIKTISGSLKPDDNRFSSQVNKICSTFSLTKDELSQVCKIKSRKTLYNWIDGTSKPRKSTMGRIFDLLIIAQAWKQSGFTNKSELINTPILDGLSVLELLTDDVLDKELILFAGSRLNLFSGLEKVLQDPFLK